MKLNEINLQKLLQKLTEVSYNALANGDDIPSEVAFINAEKLVIGMYAIAPQNYTMSLVSDGYINILARGHYDNVMVVMCASDGDVHCMASINRESRRARYQTARDLPDGFMREALFRLTA